ncbi:MAG: methyltransferase [Megasphaera sp.]|jgi:phospholipid N-methyltransferase|uniref:class I SAM-dependent methyltransferase n=1 Tax=Megasphaera sueciensis TaxID=349094 RepID=UPI003D07CC15|nr:methyltransferase [Megasphaera sp.]MCI1823081.1 methyltransferase [Megasphaera sp.]
MTGERVLFLKEFMENPRKVGSVTPSSNYLTRTMLKQLPWETINSIVELGAGTGVFTQYIIERKQLNCQFVAVEQDELMYYRLKVRYPSILMGREAKNLAYILYKHNLKRVDCIVSGLPFSNMEKIERERIIMTVGAGLKQGGIFVLFQYSLQMRSMLKQYFSEVHVRLEMRNFPPAFIYVCRK